MLKKPLCFCSPILSCKALNSMDRFLTKLDTYGWPILLLAFRVTIFYVFWLPGKFKLLHMKSTFTLFRLDYKTPLLSPELAAYLATGVELIFPVFILFGFFTRLSVLPLLFLTVVIQTTYLSCIDHLYWTLALTTILLKGPGPLSFDHYWSSRSASSSSSTTGS